MDRQTGKLIARIAENLPDIDSRVMQEWINDPKELQKFLRGLCPPDSVLVPAQSPEPPQLLLERVGTTTLAATTNPRAFGEMFKLKRDGGLCSYVGDNLRVWFGGAAEDPITEVELACDKLLRYSVDGPIIDEIGGVPRSLTGLTHLFSLMERQPKGEAPNGKDRLLNKDWWNIIYAAQKVTKLDSKRFSYVNFITGQEVVEEVENADYLFEVNGQWYVLRTVYVYWFVGGWNANALPVENPHRWNVGY